MRRDVILFILILLLTAFALTVALPIVHPTWFSDIVAAHQDTVNALTLRLGLDLQGGTQVVLEAALPEGRQASAEDIDTARVIIERRVNGLGVAEPLIQTSGDRIIVALPGVEDPDAAIQALRGTGQLEFVEMGQNPLPAGMTIITDLDATNATTDTVVYHTVLTGNTLDTVDVSRVTPPPSRFLSPLNSSPKALIFSRSILVKMSAASSASCWTRPSSRPRASIRPLPVAASSKGSLPWMKPVTSLSRCATALCLFPCRLSMCARLAPAWATTRSGPACWLAQSALSSSCSSCWSITDYPVSSPIWP